MSLSPELKAQIRDAYHTGQLEVKSVSPSGEVSWQPLTAVMQHDSRAKAIYEVVLENGSQCVVTSDHSLFVEGENGQVVAARTDELHVGSQVVTVTGTTWVTNAVAKLHKLPDREWMYDISVPGNESFVLAGSGILAHNSYSIGGVSLDIDKSSKYQSMMDSLQSRFDKMQEDAHMTIKITKGLQQPRYGVGVRSAFGPNLGTGILSPRAFVRF